MSFLRRIARFLFYLYLVVTWTGLGAVIFFVAFVIWWSIVDCAPGRTPQPYPQTLPVVETEYITATVASQTETISYSADTSIEKLVDHYTWEMLWTCERKSIQRLAPVSPDSTHYQGKCTIKGWSDGRYTFYPEGGYSFGTIQTVLVDAVIRPDGTIDVVQVNDFAQAC